MAKFGLPGDNTPRRDVFLHIPLCQLIPEELHDIAKPFSSMYGHADVRNAMMPNDEFIHWLTSNHIEYIIHSVWSDGCSLYLLNHTDDLIAFTKLSWDNQYCKVA